MGGLTGAAVAEEQGVEPDGLLTVDHMGLRAMVTGPVRDCCTRRRRDRPGVEEGRDLELGRTDTAIKAGNDDWVRRAAATDPRARPPTSPTGGSGPVAAPSAGQCGPEPVPGTRERARPHGCRLCRGARGRWSSAPRRTVLPQPSRIVTPV